MHDLVIIGAGPAGLSAASKAHALGLDVLVIERGLVGATIHEYPIGKPLFSTADEIELVPGGLVPHGSKPTREELLTHYTRFVVDSGIPVRTNEAVHSVTPVGGVFEIATSNGLVRSRTVLVATGINGFRKRLEVPGESPERVTYRFVEAYPYAGKRVLVVGSGNSAAETALYLEEVGARITLAMRRPGFGRDPATGKPEIKWWVADPLRERIGAGRLTVLFDAVVREVTPADAIVSVGGADITVACDAIFALLGTEPDLSLLDGAGVRIDADGVPSYDPGTFETNVPGLYVAGHITRERHIKGALRVGPLVAARIAVSLAAARQIV